MRDYMGSKKRSRKLLFIVASLVLCFGLASFFFVNTQTLVKVKYLLFAEQTSNAKLFNAPPEVLLVDGFLQDSAPSIVRMESILADEVDYVEELEGKVENSVSVVDKAKMIILSFSKNGGYGCFDDIDLISKMKEINEGNGHGCCSDHSEVFIALCSLFNISAREVHNNRHVFNEIYDPDAQKWLWIDPMFAIMAKGSDGDYLSLFEMRENIFKDDPINYVFFGGKYHLFKDQPVAEHEYFDNKDDFSDIMVTWGNNVFAENELYEKLALLPKSVKQLIGLTLGVTPWYKIYVDNNSSLK